MDTFGAYISVYLASSVKFLAGPAIGPALGLTAFETALFTILGMMTTVISLTLLGSKFRLWINSRFVRNRKIFTKRNRRFVKFWTKYGLMGVALLTPVLFSPVVGTLLVNAVGSAKIRIICSMLFSSIFWAVTLTAFSAGLLGWLGFA